MKSLYHFEKLVAAGVTHEEAPDVLSDYMERGDLEEITHSWGD